MPSALRSLLTGVALLAAAAVPTAAQDGGEPAPEGGVPPAPVEEPALEPAPAPPAPAPTRRTLYRDGHGGRFLLDGTWHFRLDPADQGRALGFARQRSLEGWTPVSVPHAWNAADLSNESQRGSVGWYRKDFRAPRAARTVSWLLRFESANYRATVFLNGRRIGRHEGASVPFELRAPNLSRRGVNRLVVRVDSRRSATDLPPARTQPNGNEGGGWWNYGGLLREVYLRRVDRIDIAELLVRPVLPCRACAATVLLRATLRNPGGGRRRVRLTATLDGLTARFPPVMVASGRSREVSAKVRIPDPRLWEPGSPELYAVRAVARLRRRPVASYATHIGVRSLKVTRGGRLLLNSRPLRLRGASIHEDDPEVGAALSPAHRAAIFGLLRELGATMTRAHYPLHPELYELADRAGVLIWDQIPFYQLRNEALRIRAVRDKGLRYLEDMIRRDRNHPSVLAWSIANELPSRPTTGQERYIRDAVRLAHRLDPTRLVALDFAGYPSAAPAQIYRRLDALGVNSYFGWYPGPNGQIIDRELLGAYLDQLHDYYPTEALFITEFGAEANRSGPIDEKGTYEFQREFMQFHLATYDRTPYLGGAVLWLLRDFRVRPGWDGGNPKPEPPINFKGLVGERGARKPAFEDVKRLFRDVEPLG